MKIKINQVSEKRFSDLIKEVIANNLLDLGVSKGEISELVTKKFSESYEMIAVVCAAYIHIAPKNLSNQKAVMNLCNSPVFFRASYREDVTEIEFVSRKFNDSLRDDLWGAIMDYFDNRLGGSSVNNLYKEIELCMK